MPVSRLRNILIFLCQMLVLASFAMLLARPVIPYVAETPKNEKVIILDASAGMRVSTGGETRFERAVREIRRQAESILSQDDMILSVIALSRFAPDAGRLGCGRNGTGQSGQPGAEMQLRDR